MTLVGSDGAVVAGRRRFEQHVDPEPGAVQGGELVGDGPRVERDLLAVALHDDRRRVEDAAADDDGSDRCGDGSGRRARRAAVASASGCSWEKTNGAW